LKFISQKVYFIRGKKMYNPRENRVDNVEETQPAQSNVWKQWIKAGLILTGAVGIYVASRMSGIFGLTNLLRRTSYVPPDVRAWDVKDAIVICAAETMRDGDVIFTSYVCESWARIIGKLSPEIDGFVVPTEDKKILTAWRGKNEYGEKGYYGRCFGTDSKPGSKFRIRYEKRDPSKNEYFCVKREVGPNDRGELEHNPPTFEIPSYEHFKVL
jgi:hypothetical protein